MLWNDQKPSCVYWVWQERFLVKSATYSIYKEVYIWQVYVWVIEYVEVSWVFLEIGLGHVYQIGNCFILLEHHKETWSVYLTSLIWQTPISLVVFLNSNRILFYTIAGSLSVHMAFSRQTPCKLLHTWTWPSAQNGWKWELLFHLAT